MSEIIKSKESLFSYLGYKRDDYSHLTFTPAETAKIRKYMTHLVTGSTAAIPLICLGEHKCPFSFQCPIAKIDQERRKSNPEAKSALPLTQQCIIELELLAKWTYFYIDEYEVDEHSFTELQIVRELAEIELMLWRLNNNLAKPENAELIQQDVVGVDKQGNVQTKRVTSTFLSIKDSLQNRKSRLVKLMVGDRQEKYKREAALKIREDTDLSTTTAKLRNQIEMLMKQTQEALPEKNIQAPEELIQE